MASNMQLLKYIEVTGPNTLVLNLDEDSVKIVGEVYDNISIIKMKVLSDHKFNTEEEFLELIHQNPNLEISITHIDINELDVSIITKFKHITVYDKNEDFIEVNNKINISVHNYPTAHYYDDNGNVLYELDLEKSWIPNTDRNMYTLKLVDFANKKLFVITYGDLHDWYEQHVDFNNCTTLICYDYYYKTKQITNVYYDRTEYGIYEMETVQSLPIEKSKYILNVLELLTENNIKLTFDL